jgi:hypothetical protein
MDPKSTKVIMVSKEPVPHGMVMGSSNRIYETKESRGDSHYQENNENIEQSYADEDEPVGTDIHDMIVHTEDDEFHL